jgi:multidrug resistance efflux pump
MSDLATPVPAQRPDLVVRPLGEAGEYVVKDPRSGAYYHLGEEEHFLLNGLTGRQSAEDLRTAFAERFGKPLTEEDLEEFLEMATAQGFVQSGTDSAVQPAATAPPGQRQSILHWRKNIFDPDRLFTWLAPRIWFFWTPAFLVFSAACILLAAALVWANARELAVSFLDALRWETAFLVWLTFMLVTTGHEFAHGLTCKRHGGEVHEVGFLLLFLMPCFYCNVSDAWLFREKSKRLWVTLAGGYFELFLWALAVFVWRLTQPGTTPHYLAFVVVSACGVQTLFNLNPLIKLDGYYLLSDWLEVPNLQQRSHGYTKGCLRWLLWGAARPGREAGHRTLLTYGLVSLVYSLFFLSLMIVALVRFVGPRAGVFGLAGVGLLAFLSARGVFQGFSNGEVTKMILLRHKRTAGWALAMGIAPAVLFLTPWTDRSAGNFLVRPATRFEIRAPLAGFVQSVSFDEGDRVSPGAVVARLEVPDLASRLAQKNAEVSEVEARLRLLEAGPRYEEVVEQRHRVERGRAWRDLAEQDLARSRQALREDLTRLDQQIRQYHAEVEHAHYGLAQAEKLFAQRALSQDEHQALRKKKLVSEAQEEQFQAEKRSREALGSQVAEAELARRQKELADAQATLLLLEAGNRPEEIDAERARLTRLQEEHRYLQGLQAKLPLCSPVGGVITTPRLKEKIGQYVREGDLIGVVEEPASLEVEIALAEQDVARVQSGQPVKLKARALPFETFQTAVERIAPATVKGDPQGTVKGDPQGMVTVYCRLTTHGAELRPGMTGHARIATGRRSAGMILLDRGLRYIRTEFWW